MEVKSAKVCQRLIKQGEAIAFDIREPYEFEFSNCGFRHVPMNDLPSAVKNFDKSEKIILMCYSGKRAQALGNLLETEFGFKHIIILEHGIQGWKALVDPTLILE